jgi:cytochrome d ubiquinol oxidase subunit II
MSLDLPLIWAGIIALAVFVYVLLDGFDLGIGILFPFAHNAADRDLMMSSIAPVWDGNETWLVLGGGGLLAAFPLAYAILMPAMYLPIIVMLLALILRGVAFEFRARGRGFDKAFWTGAFAVGSTVAALAQGFVLGGFIHGVRAAQGSFSGGPFDWLTPYGLLVACGLVSGYALLGAAWLVWRTSDALHGRARRWVLATVPFVALALLGVSIATLLVDLRVAAAWGIGHGIDWQRLGPRLTVPLLGAVGFAVVLDGLRRGSHTAPFAGSALIFVSGYAGLVASFVPYIVPYVITYRQAAAADNALALMLAGAVILLPLILGYTIWVYWLFRGKVVEGLYH